MSTERAEVSPTRRPAFEPGGVTRHQGLSWVGVGLLAWSLAACGTDGATEPVADAVTDVAEPGQPDVPPVTVIDADSVTPSSDAGVSADATEVVPEDVPVVGDTAEAEDGIQVDSDTGGVDVADDAGPLPADAAPADGQGDVSSVCGDGILEPDEECDEGELNSDTEPDACRTDCTVASCGDGVVDAAEACDDGDLDNTDLCKPDCTPGPDLPKPTPGQVIIQEIMVDPLVSQDPEGEWVEFLNVTDQVLSLNMCVLRADGTDSWVLGLEGGGPPVVISPNAHLMCLYVAEGEELPMTDVLDGAIFGYRNVLLTNVGDSLVLECDGVEIDRVTWDESWPLNEGATIALDPTAQDAEANDDPANWCPGTSPMEAGDLGTPLAPNLACPPPAIDACGVLAAEAPLYVDSSFSLSVDIMEPGVTDVTVDVDTPPELVVELGTGPSGTLPGTEGWSWLAGEPVDDWENALAVDRWQVSVTLAEPGVVAVAARVTLDEGETWVYCDGSEDSDDLYSLDSELTVEVLANPCAGVTCDAPPALACSPGGVTVTEAMSPDGICEIVDGAAVCDYGVTETDCGLVGQLCLAGVGCGGAPEAVTAESDLVISELMVLPLASVLPTGQWIELTNTTSAPLSLAGCSLTVGDVWSTTITEPVVVGTGANPRLLGRLDVPAANGGVTLDWAWGNSLEFPSSGADVRLHCAGVEVDAVSYAAADGWPMESGASLTLSPFRVDTTQNDDPTNWCAGSEVYGAGDLGTPGEPNPPCPGDVDPIDACFVANAQAEEVAAGTMHVAAAWISEGGVTELTVLTDPSPEILVQAGIGPADTGPTDEGWTFFPAEPAAVWEMGFAEGPPNYDSYAVTYAAPSPGPWQLAFRVSADGGNTWTSCDRVDDGVFSAAHTTDLTSVESACHPHPCVATDETVCEGDVVSVQSGSALCSLDGDASVCTWPESEPVSDCTEWGATCEAGECTGLPGLPTVGDIVVSELLVIPPTGESDEWIELSVSQDADAAVYDLSGCDITSDGGEVWTVAADAIADTLIWANAPLLLSRSASSLPVDIPPSHVYGDALVLNNLQDTLTLRCADTVIDSVSWDTAAGWPIPVGSSWALGGNLLSSTANDVPDAWCDGLIGTPGNANPLCPPEDSVLDDCRLSAPTTLEVDPGVLFSVSGLLFDVGTTDATTSVDPAPGIVVEVGYGPLGTDPNDAEAGWAWAVAYPDPNWQDVDAPGEDRWEGPLAVYDAGAWDLVMRASADDGATWTLCDHDGAANGYDSAEAGHLTIGAGVCVPNPCMEAPSSFCDGEQLTVHETYGTCALVGDPFEAECTYPSSLFDCGPYGGCVDGACIEPPLSPATFGALIITEVMRNSAGSLPDQGEWIEVYNPGSLDLDLRGCTIGDTGDSIEGLLPVIVPAGGYAVIGKTSDGEANGGIVPTAVLPSLSLANVAGHVSLNCDTGVVDDIAYTLGWPGSEAVAMQLGADQLAGDAPSIVNNIVESWCAASAPYGSAGNLGSPGAPNTACEAEAE